MLKHFVEFCYPGPVPFVFDNDPDSNVSYHEEIANRKPKLVNTYHDILYYRFYDQEQKEVDGDLLSEQRMNYSGYFYFGKTYTLRKIKKLFPQQKNLIQKMEHQRSNKAVKLPNNQWKVLEKGDTVIKKIV